MNVSSSVFRLKIETTPVEQRRGVETVSDDSIKSSKKPVPRWLTDTSYRVGGTRKVLPVDFVEKGGTAIDTVRARTLRRHTLCKRAKRKLQTMEEWVEYINKKKKIPMEN